MQYSLSTVREDRDKHRCNNPWVDNNQGDWKPLVTNLVTFGFVNHHVAEVGTSSNDKPLSDSVDNKSYLRAESHSSWVSNGHVEGFFGGLAEVFTVDSELNERVVGYVFNDLIEEPNTTLARVVSDLLEGSSILVALLASPSQVLEDDLHDVGNSHNDSSKSDGSLVILKTPESNHESFSSSLGVRNGTLSVVPLSSSSRDDEKGKTTDEQRDPEEGEHVVVEGDSGSFSPHNVCDWKIGIWLNKTNRVELNREASPY